MTDGHEFLYEFGPYTLDGRERVLLRDGRPISLAPKALETLLVLLRNSGHLVEKEQLMSEVWPATFVEDANLTQNISILRKVLSEGTNGSTYIETVPRRGYRFTVAVRRISERDISAEGEGEPQQSERAYRFLAILPFANASHDPDMEYLSDGITESIINTLSQLPQLRVMSRNSVFRYKGREVDAQRIGKDLGVDAVLVSRVQLLESRLLVSTELVDVVNGWQLWGANYDRGPKAIFEVQEEIARQISATLRIKLTGDDEQRLTKRYTESADAYQAYLQGRFYWSKFTREGLEQATTFFREAINLDPNYALAYAGIVDCYLRLATNYIPPSEPERTDPDEQAGQRETASDETYEPVKTRYKWDWTGVERELKRATELKASYPAAHQWHAAYVFSVKLFQERLGDDHLKHLNKLDDDVRNSFATSVVDQIRSANPTPAEEVQILCTIAREQMEVGNYEAGCQILRRWWTVGEWPTLNNLSSYSAGDLLFTAGSLTGWVASSRQIPAGQKIAEALLNGSIGIFEHLGARTRSCESQIELGYCYYREGLFDLARMTILNSVKRLSSEERDLKSVGLIRLAIIDRHAGRLQNAMTVLDEASGLAKLVGPWVMGRYYLEVATTLKRLAAAEDQANYHSSALDYYRKALYEFEAVGNHRYAAAVENNRGYLFLTMNEFRQAEVHLKRSRNLFTSFGDKVCCAQVDETLARLHLAEGRLNLADDASMRALDILENGDSEALLAEALTTRGIVLSRLGNQPRAIRLLDQGARLAERCGDSEGAARALFFIFEDIPGQLENEELSYWLPQLEKLLALTPDKATKERGRKCLEKTRNAGINRPDC
ncbi:MAG TPA: winged helix-turn-helix domain-containing protein [Pyrinomonadaceae bacterium]